MSIYSYDSIVEVSNYYSKDRVFYDEINDNIKISEKGPTYQSLDNDYDPSKWNERFQLLLSRPSITPEDISQTNKEINELIQDFINEAIPLVKKIVNELSLPYEEKTIKPVNVGGIAGGEKYIVGQIFMKIARDNSKLNLYNGDKWAQKVAMHELLSLNSLISCRISQLHFPIMALISCYGYQVIVTSKLPIDSRTIKYGSPDGGHTVYYDQEIAHLMKMACEKLNLRPHYIIERKTRFNKLIYGPIDIEGHVGYDGRMYIIDSSRLFPPTTLQKEAVNSYLYKLLRKELVLLNPESLSSDALSPFNTSEEDNERAIAATNRIFDIIPEIIKDEENMKKRLVDFIHQYGINLRYLGVILMECKRVNLNEEVQHIVLIEMCARSFKSVLFQHMRDTEPQANKNITKHDICIDVCVSDFNSLLLNNPEFWNEMIIKDMSERFIFTRSHERINYKELKGFIGEELFNQALLKKDILFERASKLTGVVFSINFNPSRGKDIRITKEHIENIEIKAKHLTVQTLNIKELELFYLKELETRINKLGEYDPYVAITHKHLGQLYSDYALNMEKALMHYNKAEEILAKSDIEIYIIERAEILVLKADLLTKYDRNIEALNLLENASNIYEDFLQSYNYIRCREKLANVNMKLGNFDISKSILLDTLDKKKKMFKEESDKVAKTLNDLAQIHFTLKNFDSAKLCINEGLEILRKCRKQEEHSEFGIFYSNLAKILSIEGNYKQAEEYFEKALKIFEVTLGESHSQIAITLDHRAINYLLLSSKRSNLAKSKSTILEMYNRSLKIVKKNFGINSSIYAIIKNNLGKVYNNFNMIKESQECFNVAYNILKVLFPHEHPLIKTISSNLSNCTQPKANLVSISHLQHITDKETSKITRSEDKKQKSSFGWRSLFNLGKKVPTPSPPPTTVSSTPSPPPTTVSSTPSPSPPSFAPRMASTSIQFQSLQPPKPTVLSLERKKSRKKEKKKVESIHYKDKQSKDMLKRGRSKKNDTEFIQMRESSYYDSYSTTEYSKPFDSSNVISVIEYEDDIEESKEILESESEEELIESIDKLDLDRQIELEEKAETLNFADTGHLDIFSWGTF